MAEVNKTILEEKKRRIEELRKKKEQLLQNLKTPINLEPETKGVNATQKNEIAIGNDASSKASLEVKTISVNQSPPETLESTKSTSPPHSPLPIPRRKSKPTEPIPIQTNSSEHSGKSKFSPPSESSPNASKIASSYSPRREQTADVKDDSPKRQRLSGSNRGANSSLAVSPPTVPPPGAKKMIHLPDFVRATGPSTDQISPKESTSPKQVSPKEASSPKSSGERERSSSNARDELFKLRPSLPARSQSFIQMNNVNVPPAKDEKASPVVSPRKEEHHDKLVRRQSYNASRQKISSIAAALGPPPNPDQIKSVIEPPLAKSGSPRNNIAYISPPSPKPSPVSSSNSSSGGSSLGSNSSSSISKVSVTTSSSSNSPTPQALSKSTPSPAPSNATARPTNTNKRPTTKSPSKINNQMWMRTLRQSNNAPMGSGSQSPVARPVNLYWNPVSLGGMLSSYQSLQNKMKAFRRCSSAPALYRGISNQTKDSKIFYVRRTKSQPAIYTWTGSNAQGTGSANQNKAPLRLVFESAGDRHIVKSGTTDQLIDALFDEELITSQDVAPSQYIDVFCNVYLYFCDAKRMLVTARTKFISTEKQSADPLFRLKTHLRIVNFLKKWIRFSGFLLEEDAELLKELTSVIKVIGGGGSKHSTNWKDSLQTSMNQQVNFIAEWNRPLDARLLQFVQAEPVGSSDLPKNTLLTLNPMAVAKEITFWEYVLFRRIHPIAFLKGAKYGISKQAKLLRDTQLTLCRNFFNNITSIAAAQILSLPTPRDRASLICRFIDIANCCIKINNFNGAMQFTSALKSVAIERMSVSWQYVPQNYLDQLESLSVLLDGKNNYSAYRKQYIAAPFPKIPFAAVFLRDFVYYEENPTFLQDGSVNFGKLWMLGEHVLDLRKVQELEYQLTSDPAIMPLMFDCPIIHEDTLWAMSSALEPKSSSVSALEDLKRKKRGSRLIERERASLRKELEEREKEEASKLAKKKRQEKKVKKTVTNESLKQVMDQQEVQRGQLIRQNQLLKEKLFSTTQYNDKATNFAKSLKQETMATVLQELQSIKEQENELLLSLCNALIAENVPVHILEDLKSVYQLSQMMGEKLKDLGQIEKKMVKIADELIGDSSPFIESRESSL